MWFGLRVPQQFTYNTGTHFTNMNKWFTCQTDDALLSGITSEFTVLQNSLQAITFFFKTCHNKGFNP